MEGVKLCRQLFKQSVFMSDLSSWPVDQWSVVVRVILNWPVTADAFVIDVMVSWASFKERSPLLILCTYTIELGSFHPTPFTILPVFFDIFYLRFLSAEKCKKKPHVNPSMVFVVIYVYPK